MAKKKYNYPMEFKVCKACGCKEELVTEEFNARNPGNKKTVAATAYAVLLVAQTGGILTPKVPMLMANVGICPKCGTLRATLITETEVPSDFLQQSTRQSQASKRMG